MKQGKWAPIYLLHGKESYFIDELTNYVEEHVLTETEKAFNQSVLYGKDVDFKQVLDHVRQFPVMSDKRVVILKEAQSMKTLSDLKSYMEKPNQSAVLVIAHKHKKLDKRTGFFKAAKKHALVFESTPMYENKVPAWIESHMREKGIKIDPVACDMMVECLGSDLGLISNEIDKMLLNLKSGQAVTRDIVLENIGISKEYNVFELQSAISNRDTLKIHRIVKHFVENPKSNPLIMLISNLFSFYSKLYIAKSLGPVSGQEMAAAIGLRSAFFVKDYQKAIRHYSLEDLENCISIIHGFDLRSKGINNRTAPEGELLREMIESLLYVRRMPRQILLSL